MKSRQLDQVENSRQRDSLNSTLCFLDRLLEKKKGNKKEIRKGKGGKKAKGRCENMMKIGDNE